MNNTCKRKPSPFFPESYLISEDGRVKKTHGKARRDNMKWLKDGLYINDNDELVTEEGKHFWIKTESLIKTEENKNDISYRCSCCYVGFAEKTEICPNCKSEMDMTEWGYLGDEEEV